MTSDAIRILCLEDSPADALLIRHQVGKSAFSNVVTTVECRDSFLAALAVPDAWDVIISDWHLPGYGGMQAFQDARQRGCVVPFLVVSGHIGADEAVEALKAGVTDYVLKDRLERLPMALQRSLDEVRIRTDQQLARQRQEDSERRFRLLAEASQDLIILCDHDDRILYVNPITKSWFNRDQDELIGRSLADLLPTDSFEWFRTQQAKVRSSGKPHQGELALTASQRWFDVMSVPFQTDGVLTVARDLTTRKQQEEELRNASLAAQAASLAKSQFLSVMSHELRTPLNGLLGITSLLVSAGLEPRLGELAEMAHRCGQGLLDIIIGILDFSNLEIGELHLESKTFDLHRLLIDLEAQFRPLAEEKSLILQVKVSGTVPVQVEGDPLRLLQVLANVLVNAVKFTDCGQVQVRVRVAAGQGNRIRLRVSVTDSGIGIAEQDLKHLFKPFSQVDGTSTRRHGGCGIGLVITRRLLDLMEGTIEVESTLGVGSCFTLEIPLIRSCPVPTIPGPTADAPQPPLVLIVDDEAVNRLVLRRMLEAGGCRVMQANDGSEAIRAHRMSAPALILMDAQMPNMDGCEATLAIRQQESPTHHVPIIAITATINEAARQRCRAAGMDGFLPKPIHQKTLWKIITTHTGWRRT